MTCMPTSCIGFHRIPGEHSNALRADPIQLQQVILNLVKNAIEAIAIGERPSELSDWYRPMMGSRLCRFLSRMQDRASPSMAGLIIDPILTRQPSGMGLGMSSWGIIEEHGGNLLLTETTSKVVLLKLFYRSWRWWRWPWLSLSAGRSNARRLMSLFHKLLVPGQWESRCAGRLDLN